MRRKAIIALVFIVAGAVLVESWHAAMNAAATGGRPWPWLWPSTLEAFIFVLVLVYWDARSNRQPAWTARVFLVLTTAVASAVQILDAPPTWLGWLTAGWTPVALLLAVEFAVGRLYAQRPDPVPTPLGQPVPEPTPEPAPDPEPVPVPPTPPRGTQGAAVDRQPGPVSRGGPPVRPRYSTVLNPADRAEVVRRAEQGQSAPTIAKAMGLSDRALRYRVRPVVREVQQRQATDRYAHRNGDGGGS